MVPCTQGIPDDKLWWRYWLCLWADNLPHFSCTQKAPIKIVLFYFFLLLLSPYIRKNEKSSTMIRIDIYLKPSITVVLGWIQPPLISKWSKLSTFTEMQQFSKWWHPRTRRAYFLRPDDYGATTVTGKILKRAPRSARVEIQKSSSFKTNVDLTIFWRKYYGPRVTLIVTRPPILTSFRIISFQMSSNVLKCPQMSSNFLQFPLKLSISSQPGWQAGTIKAILYGPINI